MVRALVLSGGAGKRFGGEIPKQYVKVCQKPVIMYCLEKLQCQEEIGSITIVAEKHWQQVLFQWIYDEKIKKAIYFAEAGSSRQHSVLRGLEEMKRHGAEEDDIVIIHDAVRPCVSSELLKDCILCMSDADGVMPVVAVKDTIYWSSDGVKIDSLLPRDNLYAGQTPEGFRFGKYYAAHRNLNEKELDKFSGSSEIAYKAGLTIRMIPGDEENYKITMRKDLERFRLQMENCSVNAEINCAKREGI